MSIPAGPTFDAFSSTIDASNPFTSSDMPLPLSFAVAYRLCLWPFRPQRLCRTLLLRNHGILHWRHTALRQLLPRKSAFAPFGKRSPRRTPSFAKPAPGITGYDTAGAGTSGKGSLSVYIFVRWSYQVNFKVAEVARTTATLKFTWYDHLTKMY